MPFGVGEFGHEFKLDEALKSLSEKDMFKRVVCGVCSDIPHDPQQTDVRPTPPSPLSFQKQETDEIVRPYLLPRLHRQLHALSRRRIGRRLLRLSLLRPLLHRLHCLRRPTSRYRGRQHGLPVRFLQPIFSRTKV